MQTWYQKLKTKFTKPALSPSQQHGANIKRNISYFFGYAVVIYIAQNRGKDARLYGICLAGIALYLAYLAFKTISWDKAHGKSPLSSMIFLAMHGFFALMGIIVTARGTFQ